jgi:hypothetical protein
MIFFSLCGTEAPFLPLCPSGLSKERATEKKGRKGKQAKKGLALYLTEHCLIGTEPKKKKQPSENYYELGIHLLKKHFSVPLLHLFRYD